MRIAFNVQDEIQAKGWSEAWYEGEEVAKDVARSLQYELWRTCPELGGQIAQPIVEADGENVTIETAHSELEEAIRKSFEQALLETLSASYPEYFFDETAGGLADDIVFGENGEVDRWIDSTHERLLGLGVEWSGLPADAEYVTDTEFQRVIALVLIELEDTLTDFRVENQNPLLGIEDLMQEGYYLDLAESVSINGFDCDGEDAKRVQDLIDDLEANPHVDLGSDEIHAAMLKSDESGLGHVARKLEGTGLYDVTEVVQECVNEYSKIFRPDLAEEWPDVAKATSEALEQLVSDIEDGDRPLDYLYQEAQNACIYYVDVVSIIDAIGLSKLEDLVDEPQIATEALPGEEVSLSMVFTRLAAMAMERLTVTYAVEALSVLARELKS